MTECVVTLNESIANVERLIGVCKKHGIVNVTELIAFVERHSAEVNPEPPQVAIVWYQTPDKLNSAYWEPAAAAEGVTVEQLLLESEMYAQDESGNEVAVPPGADVKGMRVQGCWGFVDSDSNTIHAWAAPDADADMVLHMLAHEIGHVTGVPHPDELQEEFRAEQFGRVAAQAFRLYQQRGELCS